MFKKETPSQNKNFNSKNFYIWIFIFYFLNKMFSNSSYELRSVVFSAVNCALTPSMFNSSKKILLWKIKFFANQNNLLFILWNFQGQLTRFDGVSFQPSSPFTTSIMSSSPDNADIIELDGFILPCSSPHSPHLFKNESLLNYMDEFFQDKLEELKQQSSIHEFNGKLFCFNLERKKTFIK